MLRAVGCRARASIGDCALVSRALRSSGHDAAVDKSTSSRGLGLLGSAGPQARTCAGRLNDLLPGAVKEAVQVWNNLSLNGSAGRLGDAARPFQLNLMRGFVQLRTNLEVADNSGARRVQCIKVMKGSNAAQIGDTIMASVKDAQPRGKVKKGEVVTCVVVRAATHKLRRDGSEIRFDKNAVVLVNKQGEPIGTRIFGPVPHELRRRKLVKILTLAEHVT